MFSRLYRGVRSVATWALDPSDVEAIKQSVKITIRAIILAINWVVLIGITLFLNTVLEYAMNVANAPDVVRNLLSPMLWMTLVTLVVAITITSVVDVINLAKAGLKNPDERKDGTQR